MFTRSWRASAQLRMRVNISEMGSVIMGSPARLDHAGDFTAQCEETKTNAAQLELAVVAASASANLATVACANLEFWSAIELCKLTCTSHYRFLSGSPEGHSQLLEKGAALFVGVCRRHNGDVHSLDDVDAVVVDLREDDL